MACSPNSEFRLLNEGNYRLKDFSGQWVIINFWAEWCAPCREEVPELNQLSLESDKLNLKVIGISYDKIDNQGLLKIAKSWDMAYSIMASEPIPILPFSLPPTLPTNYILNPDGEVAVKLVGKQTKETLELALSSAKSEYKALN